MLRTTAILNLKGGVAKTTTAINMAAILARDYKARVLLVDADSQCNTTEFFGGDPAKGNLAMILRNAQGYSKRLDLAQQCIHPTRYERVDLLAGDDSLMDMDLSKVEQGTVSANVFRSLVAEVSDRYDYLLVDCPPAFNAACAAALIAADDVILPIKLDAFSLRGMGNLMRQIKNMRSINPKLTLAGCLPTMWYDDDLIRDSESKLRAAGLPVFHHIRQSRPVNRMTYQQEPLVISSPTSAACVDYKKFVSEYVGGAKNG